MLLRRVMEHVKTQNWTAVVIDFVIVVVGVFIGIQVSNWNADLKNKGIAYEYVERIQEELLANQDDVKLRTKFFGQIKSHALRALAALDEPPASLGEDFVIDSYMASHALSRRISRSAYDELLAAGDISTYIPVAARRRIDEYYRTLKGAEDHILEIPEYRIALRGALPYLAQAQLMVGDCKLVLGVDNSGEQTAILPGECALEITDQETELAVTQILDAEIRRGLTYRLADIDLKLQLFQSVTDRAQNLYDYLEETK